MPFTLAQQIPEPDTLAADSLVADSLARVAADSAAADTATTFTQLNQEIEEAGRLLIAGEWKLFWERLYTGLADLLITFIPKVLTALFVFVLFYVSYRVLNTLLNRGLTRSKRIDTSLRNLLVKTYRVAALSFIAVMVLAQLGVNVAALLAGLSIVGIAVGFAARDTLENFISGITILLDKPFRLGDNLEVDTIFGAVEEITLRSTRLRTLNNEIVVVPNIQMINQKLINHTKLNTVRVEIPFGIAYKEYPHLAREAVLKTLEGDERLSDDLKPKVVVTGLNASSVDMALLFYIKNPKLEIPIRFEYLEKVREALRDAGIEIPFPHLQLFIDEAKAFDESFIMRPELPLPDHAPHPPEA